MNPSRSIAGLVHPRSEWPTTLARWSTSGALAVEFLTCMSANELSAILGSGRTIDAVLLDGASAQVDRDLVGVVRRHGPTPIGVETLGAATDWDALGVTGVLRSGFDADELTELLGRLCDDETPMVRRSIRASLDRGEEMGSAVSVCGPGGAGASVVAMALSQGLARDGAAVTLLDGATRGHLAMYHHCGDVIPGLGDLVGRTRRSTIDPAEVDPLTFATGRGYRLMLGVTTPREAHSLPPAATAEAIDVLRRDTEFLVVDHDGDTHSTAIGTSLAERSAAWIVVTDTGIRGTHDGARFVAEALAAGVPAERVVLLCNRTRRSDPARLTFSQCVDTLLGSGNGVSNTAFLPPVRIETVHRDASLLPASLVQACLAPVTRVLETHGSRQPTSHVPALVEAM